MTMTTASYQAPSQTQWIESVRDDLQHMENRIAERSKMGNEMLDAAVEMIIRGGGKRMRPAITVLGGRLFQADYEKMISVAASIELLHTATLVHDDLIDGADQRRGVPTLHNTLSAGVTVLTGDYLFAQSANLAAEADSVPVIQLFSDTLVRICKGEILQAQTRWQVPDFDLYIERIYGKTAALFEAAARAGTLLTEPSQKELDAMGRYGCDLGLAFQIIDDALDFVSTEERLGKPAASDMRQGIFNLPIMYLVESGTLTKDSLIERIENNDDMDGLVKMIRQSGVIERSLEVARDYANRALEELDYLRNDEPTDMLRQITNYAVSRSY